MFENILFYLIFLSQVLLISYYYPKKIAGRIQHVLTTYPPKEYPKLYPTDNACFTIGHKPFKIFSYFILAIGIIIFGLVARWDLNNSGKVSEAIPIAYFFLQMVPLVLMEVSEFALFKRMRKSDTRKTRTADLLPRNLFDFISPFVFAVAVGLLIACLLFFYNLHGFALDFDNDTFVIFLGLFFSNSLFGGMIYWNIYGKKLNPYQTTKDRLHQIEVTVKSLTYISIVASIFLICTEAVDEYGWDFLEPCLMSLYLQFIVFLGIGSVVRKIRLEDVDFEVYRIDASAV